jgi:HEAT repeat protein
MLALLGIAAAAAVLPGLPTLPAPAATGRTRPPVLWPGTAGDALAALAARDEAQRLRAVIDLASEDDARAVPLLLPVLRDRDPGVRLTAARLLARRGAREATLAATAWVGEPGARERLMGLLVLRDAADLPDEARRAVERALRTGDVTSRLQGLELLAVRPAKSSFAAVVALLDDEMAEVRLRALRALASMADPRASLAVTRRLGDGDRGVRAEAVATLGALGDRRVVPALLRALDDASVEPRAPVADALGRLADPAAVPALARVARRVPRDDLARHAALALGTVGTPAAVEALLTIAREPPGGDDVRVALERAGPAAVPRLAREVGGGSPTSARLAAEALGAMGDRRATPALVAAVLGASFARVAALEALARLADPAAVPALVHAANEAEAPELRVLALDALEATRDERAVAVLPRALADGAPSVRARAARLAGAVGGGPEAAALVGRVEDADPIVRREAAAALARLPALPADLARPLVDAVARVALEAASAEALAGALERVCGAGDRALRAVLARAYQKATTPAARAVLARGLAVAAAEAPLEDASLIAALLGDVSDGGEVAPAAAEALGRAKLARPAEATLAGLFARTEPTVRARLAPALARFEAGAGILARTLSDASEPPSVRAAAAWALADGGEVRAALAAAVGDAEPAVAANARAALALAGTRAHRRSSWSAVEVTSAGGEACAGCWVAVTAGDGPAVWALTDARGRARVGGLPDGPIVLRLASPPATTPGPPAPTAAGTANGSAAGFTAGFTAGFAAGFAAGFE